MTDNTPEWEIQFNERIKQRDSRMYGYYKSVFQEGFEGGYPIEWNEEDKAFISKVEKEAEERENLEWLKGRRCYTCGNAMEAKPLTDTCADCWENA